MAYESIENLPQDVKEQLPPDAQYIFQTAYNSANSDGLSDEASMQVAWNSIMNGYVKGEDGKWHRKEEGAYSPGSQGSTGTMGGG
jgi:cation transport regulator